MLISLSQSHRVGFQGRVRIDCILNVLKDASQVGSGAAVRVSSRPFLRNDGSHQRSLQWRSRSSQGNTAGEILLQCFLFLLSRCYSCWR